MKVVDLFCGAGGFSYGFQQAGFDIVLGVDNDRTVIETFKENHHAASIWKSDIRDVDGREITRLYGNIDVLIGSPPCVDFSSVNTHPDKDQNRGLEMVREFLRIRAEIEPRWSIMENVPNARPFIEPLIPEHRSQLLNAADFGVPQIRRRIFIGNNPSPVPTHSNNGWQRNLLGQTLRPWVKLGEILEDNVNWGIVDERRDHNLQRLKGAREIPSGKMGKMEYPDPLDRPSRTLLAKISRMNRSTIIVAPEGRRRLLTVRERARIQGFPDDYLWLGTVGRIEVMIGNAVPPPVSKALALAILGVV